MKRILLVLFLSLAMGAILIGCRGQTQPTPPATKAEPATPPAPSTLPLAVGEMVYASFFQAPNNGVELAKVQEIKGDEVKIA